MRIAIPVANAQLSMHFGHCEQFALFDVDEGKKAITRKEIVQAPDHQPGLLPRWLAERGVDVVIAGGMGMRAQQMFASQNIRVGVGAPAGEPEAIALAYVSGTLETGPNVCDH